MSKIFDDVRELIAPHNRKGVTVTPETTFATDLEWDSLTVMDFVAETEDHFDIIIPLNLLPDLETVGQVADAIEGLIEKKNG